MTPPPLANERVALYRRVLGEAWDSLPEPLRAMHDLDGERNADGVAVVERGTASQVFAAPQTPYTKALIAAAFNLETVA